MTDQRIRAGCLQIFLLQQAVNLRCSQLQAKTIGFTLNHLAELDLHAARQADAVLLFQQIGDTTLAGLAVDADDRLVAAADISRINRQVGDFPNAVRVLLGKALANRILVRTGEGGVDQIADIRVARMNR